ncbi:MAG: hypothetical protein N2044_05600 [Cyclobacteriaceae bacterium]|nr:hypothetical protein [Cyclobacteriaceae bacterium]MCX7637307.1 hypothetical protein [Cyclobacteriaceae bacterium]MDW8331114.1 hypothetical protein [Cyclobacteriaceae bacterium]
MKTDFTIRVIRILNAITLVATVFTSQAQQLNINLSSVQQEKLSRTECGRKRLLKFYRYYRKDSLREAKRLKKEQLQKFDSLINPINTAQFGNRVLDSLGPNLGSFKAQLTKWQNLLGDTTLSDSTRYSVRDSLQYFVALIVKEHPSFQYLEGRYRFRGDSVSWDKLVKDVPLLDTVSGIFQSSPNQLFSAVEKITEKQLSSYGLKKENIPALHGIIQDSNFPVLPSENRFEKEIDPESILSQSKDKAVEKVMDYFAENPEQLEKIQSKVSRLFSKYRIFSNSNDLQDTRKHTSMEGKTLFERLVMGGTLNVVAIRPVSADLSLQLGYKFTSRFFVGAGFSYRITFGDTIKSLWPIFPSNLSIKTFASYDLVKSWYGYAEGEWAYAVDNSSKELQIYDTKWYGNYFIGAGRRLLIHPKIYLTITALYNLNGSLHNPIYPKRFQVRVGFQLSELATRKKRIYYNPNN